LDVTNISKRLSHPKIANKYLIKNHARQEMCMMMTIAIFVILCNLCCCVTHSFNPSSLLIPTSKAINIYKST
jgi:type IV secretory pathway VirB10-like protein